MYPHDSCDGDGGGDEVDDGHDDARQLLTRAVCGCIRMTVKVVPAQNCPRDRNDSEAGEGHQDIIVNTINVSININIILVASAFFFNQLLLSSRPVL